MTVLSVEAATFPRHPRYSLILEGRGFSRMVEWADTRRIGIRWKPYKDVAKASTAGIHLGNLREHSIAQLSRGYVAGTDNVTTSSWPRSSFASSSRKPDRFVSRIYVPTLSDSPRSIQLALRSLILFYLFSFPLYRFLLSRLFYDPL